MSSINHANFAHLKIPLEHILSATNNFAEENRLNTYSNRNVYMGDLHEDEMLVMIDRRLNKERDDEIEQQFWMEIFMLSTLKHKNLVSLIGFCDENDEKIIITKLEMSGRLINHVRNETLTWVQILEICVALAHVLSYIHYDKQRDFSIIHRHICSANVVLSDCYEPKLCYFDFSKKVEVSQRHLSFHTNKLEYVNGYGDPTYIETNNVSHKSDMYSFGIILFELLSGRESISDAHDNKYLLPVAIFHYRNKILDELIVPVLWEQMNPQSLNIFAETAYDCLNEERSRRPDIGEVVTRLEEALKLQLASAKRPVRHFFLFNLSIS